MAITTTEVKAAAAELARMRSALASWMKVRSLNDQVMAGTVSTRKPLSYAQRVVASSRDMAAEQDLADKLHALLEVVMKGVTLPSADLRSNPNGAMQLAQVALTGGAAISSPTSTDGLFGGGHPWLWPVLIVAGVLLTITTAIRTVADVAKDREEKACIEAGACTDYGFWLKAGGVALIAWFAWKEMGLKDLLKKGRA